MTFRKCVRRLQRLSKESSRLHRALRHRPDPVLASDAVRVSTEMREVDLQLAMRERAADNRLLQR